MNYFNFIKSFLFISYFYVDVIESCSSFYCINSCGYSNTNKGYKLILANNRDENVNRITQSAKVWLPRIDTWRLNDQSLDDNIECDQSNLSPPYNLCAYGALDLAIGKPPNFYSTWLGMNERGTVGNLLFYMSKASYKEKLSRGVIVSNAIQNSSWANTDMYMNHLYETRYNFNPFNYIQLEMSPKTGLYSMYYINNVENKTHVKLNPDESSTYFFAISNSNLDYPFKKVTNGKEEFKNIIDNYSIHQNKNELVLSLIKLLQNTTDNYPDENLSLFMNRTGSMYEKMVRGVSRIKADYTTYWPNAQSRTSTLILVDYDDNVEYFEYNLTTWSRLYSSRMNKQEWTMNEFGFKLRPLYKITNSENTNSGIIIKNSESLISSLIAMSILFMYKFLNL